MKLIIIILSTITFRLSIATAGKPCPILGQQYPPPSSLASDAKFEAVTKKITQKLTGQVKTAPYNETSFSLVMFSAADEGLIYEYYHTAAAVANSTQGAKSITADSIYNLGSISKLLTVYLWLVSEGDTRFSDPISKYIPQLTNSSNSWNDVVPSWTDITVGDLAGQMAGLARDYGLADISPPNFGTIGLPAGVVEKAFPKLPKAEVPSCGYLLTDGTYLTCTQEQYLHGVMTESPIFPTATTTVYSNEAFALLGVALSNIVGKPIAEIFDDVFRNQLSLSSTYEAAPHITEDSVVPGNPTTSGWNADFGVFAPVGGYFSSAKDMAKLGKSILRSDILSKAVTNRWLKPTSFVESVDQGVGRPWEIFRRMANGQVVDLYTKGGDWGVYHSAFLLLPAYNFGIVILTAGSPGATDAETVRDLLPETVVDDILAVLDPIAEAQAAANFAGTYSSNATNSSITIAATDAPGLQVTAWTSNGIDLFEELWDVEFGGLTWSLVPNQLQSGNMVGFTSYYSTANIPDTDSTWYLLSCSGWLGVDELNYGNIPIGQMVFEVDGDGKATSVDLRALRVVLQRTQ